VRAAGSLAEAGPHAHPNPIPPNTDRRGRSRRGAHALRRALRPCPV